MVMPFLAIINVFLDLVSAEQYEFIRYSSGFAQSDPAPFSFVRACFLLQGFFINHRKRWSEKHF